MNRSSRCEQWALTLLMMAAAIVLAVRAGEAQSEPVGSPDESAQSNQPPETVYITVRNPGDPSIQLAIENAAEELQRKAVAGDQESYLILQIERGSSKFGAVRDLAKSLTSARFSRVRTIAWIPQSLDGNNVLLALACKEIVMHPDAVLGDIGLGRTVDKDDQLSVLSLVEKRHNPQLSRGLVLALMDRKQVLYKVKVHTDGEIVETRVVTADELRRYRDNRLEIRDVQMIKEAGADPVISGSKAQSYGILAAHVVETRAELAEVYRLPTEVLREDPTSLREPKVYLIRIRGEIEPVLVTFVQRQIDRAVAGGATHIIFEITSPGGLVMIANDLANAIADLDPEQVRTIAYVPNAAISAAAMIALGADEIYIHPNALFGDILPMTHDGEQFQHVPQKVLSMVSQMLKHLAERKNRPEALLMAMADKDLVVYEVTHRETGRTWYMSDDELHHANDEWIKGPPVSESKEGTVVTLTGKRAHELGLANAPVKDFEGLKSRLGIPADVKVHIVDRTWVDKVVFYLNTPGALFILFTLGVVLIFLDLHLMTGFLGICAALCFALFFWSRFLGGTAGWLEVVLFVLGISCLALEIFVIPGFGVFGISGAALIFVALIMASQTFGNFEPNSDLRPLSRSVGTLAASLVCVLVMGVLLNRFLPQMPILNRAILTPPGAASLDGDDAPRLSPELLDNRPGIDLVGERGFAVSTLRPAGKAEINGEYRDVVSDGPFIQQGTPVEVIEVVGNRIVVREV